MLRVTGVSSFGAAQGLASTQDPPGERARPAGIGFTERSTRPATAALHVPPSTWPRAGLVRPASRALYTDDGPRIVPRAVHEPRVQGPELVSQMLRELQPRARGPSITARLVAEPTPPGDGIVGSLRNLQLAPPPSALVFAPCRTDAPKPKRADRGGDSEHLGGGYDLATTSRSGDAAQPVFNDEELVQALLARSQSVDGAGDGASLVEGCILLCTASGIFGTACSREQAQQIVPHLAVRSLERYSQLYREGTFGQHAYIVLRGTVQLRSFDGGEETTASAGAWVGEEAFWCCSERKGAIGGNGMPAHPAPLPRLCTATAGEAGATLLAISAAVSARHLSPQGCPPPCDHCFRPSLASASSDPALLSPSPRTTCVYRPRRACRYGCGWASTGASPRDCSPSILACSSRRS